MSTPDPTSRYAMDEVAQLRLPSGEVVAYTRRRLAPQGAAMAVMAEVSVLPGERVDNLAQRALGDPLAFWRLCDANDAMDPAELVADPGRRLRVPLPGR